MGTGTAKHHRWPAVARFMRYLVLGSGRLGRCLSSQLAQRGAIVDEFSARRPESWPRDLSSFHRVLICVPDRHIESSLRELISLCPDLNPQQVRAKCVHFSATLDSPGVFWCHPLFSFVGQDLDREQFDAIFFTVAEDAEADFNKQHEFANCFPMFTNQLICLPEEDRFEYHAWAVLVSNLATKAVTASSIGLRALGVPPAATAVYLRSILERADQNGTLPSSGPIERRDWATLKNDVDALGQSPWARVLGVFLEDTA